MSNVKREFHEELEQLTQETDDGFFIAPEDALVPDVSDYVRMAAETDE